MTTLQFIGARLSRCIPKLKHYGLLLGLCFLYTFTVALTPTECSERNHFNRTSESSILSPDTAATADTLIVIPLSTIPDTVLIRNCDANIGFQSDGYGSSSYKDDLNAPRNNVLIICPNSTERYLNVSFSHFDLDEGDTLYAFSGQDTTGQMIAKGSGRGVQFFNGGWVASNCDQALNATGCLTFQFKTNGNNSKGAGWDAWVKCESRPLSISPPDNQFLKLECDELKHSVTIKAGAINANCILANDTLRVEIINAKGTVCKDTCLRADSTFVIDTLAIGSYTIRHTLKQNPTITAENFVIISPPAISCNDEVKAVLGAACMAVIQPDDILENPCDTSAYLYYDITIKRPDGTIIKSGTSRNGAYPIITKEDVEICGNTRYQIEITRVYDYGGRCCSEGLIKDVCWGYISFVDGTAPQFTRHVVDTIMACKVDIDKIGQFVTKPTTADNCDSVSLSIKKAELIDGDECAEARTYLITWEAKDLCGKTATQDDTLRVLRPKLDSIIKLPNVMIGCEEEGKLDMEDYKRLGIVKMIADGDTITLSTEEYVCNYIITKKDELIPHLGGSKIARYWAIVDGCSSRPIPIRVDTQLIEFIDTLPPSIECEDFTSVETAAQIPLPPFSCTSEVKLGKPKATDLCDPNPLVEMFCVEQLENGTWWKIANNLLEAGELPCDTFRVGWQASDGAVNQTINDTCFQYFRLIDVTPPSTICKDEINIAFDKGHTRIFAAETDNDSWDACGIVKMEIRRDSGEWGEFIDFYCTDVHKLIKTELRLTDKGGNTNTCQVDARVLDLIPPICDDLPDLTASCDEFHNNELGNSTDINEDYDFNENEWRPLTNELLDLYNDRFGNPNCADNLVCVPFSSEQQYQVIYSPCGEAKVQRRYRIIDWNGEGIASEWYIQNINITYQPNWSILLPADFYGECGDETPDADITIQNGACDILGWEHEDQVFDLVQDACYKVVRTYYIINWCKYEQGQEPIEIGRDENVLGLVYDRKTITHEDIANYGYYKYTQVLKIIDNEAPIISINNVSTCIYGVGDAAPAGEEDLTPNAEPFECDTIKSFTAEARDCVKSFFKNFSFEYWVSEDGVPVGHGEGSKFFWTVRPKVLYTIKFKTYDNCGNAAVAEKEFQFWDCRRPVVSCIDSIIADISEDSTVVIKANAFNKGSFDNCTPQEQLKFKIWHESISNDPPTTKEEVASLPNAVQLGCDYLGVQPVRIYVLDEENNFDFCLNHAIIQNNFQLCPPNVEAQSLITGTIHTSKGIKVENVAINITENGTNTIAAITGSDGNYAFYLDKNAAYTVFPQKDTDPTNGVSTYDLVLMSKHILGLKTLQSPYQHIAADVNKSGTITAYDMVLVRQLILNINNDFPNNESWRFVDANYEFTSDTPLAENFTEVVQIDNLSSDRMNANFVAIKTGDLNGNALANGLQSSEERTTYGTMELIIQDQNVRQGETFTIDFNTDELSKITGYQFALDFKNLELVRIEEGLAKVNHFGQGLVQRGLLLTSWNTEDNSLNDANSQYLFGLIFKAKKTGQLSEFLQLQPDYLATEAYDKTGEALDIKLQFETTNYTLELKQNRPNPFRETTRIGFHLPKAKTATLSIIDLQGNLLKQLTKGFPAGYNEWIIDGQSLTSKGILYYRLETDTEVLTKKMMLIE